MAAAPAASSCGPIPATRTRSETSVRAAVEALGGLDGVVAQRRRPPRRAAVRDDGRGLGRGHRDEPDRSVPLRGRLPPRAAPGGRRLDRGDLLRRRGLAGDCRSAPTRSRSARSTGSFRCSRWRPGRTGSASTRCAPATRRREWRASSRAGSSRGDTGGMADPADRAHRHRRGRRGRGRLLPLSRLLVLQRLGAARRRRHACLGACVVRDDRNEVSGVEGRVALVTGGTSGIGKACVERLLRGGHDGRFHRAATRSAARPWLQRPGRRSCAATPATAAGSDRAVEETLRLGGGRLDVLVANAGILMSGSIEETPEAAFRELVEVNLTSLFRASRACFGRCATRAAAP